MKVRRRTASHTFRLSPAGQPQLVRKAAINSQRATGV